MPAKVDTYLDLARETAQGLAGSVGAWTAFLDTASRLYKYPFADQHIAGEQRLCVKTKNTGRKIVIRRFHIAITVVDADDFCVVHCFHSSSFLLRCSLQIFR